MVSRPLELGTQHMERVTGIEPALSAWESDRSGPLTTLTWASDAPLVTVMDPGTPGLMARQWPARRPTCRLGQIAAACLPGWRLSRGPRGSTASSVAAWLLRSAVGLLRRPSSTVGGTVDVQHPVTHLTSG
jgi:hypothetical protein